MFSNPTNSDRADWADTAVRAFMGACRTDREYAIQDLMCNMLHLARREGLDPQQVLSSAEMHFDAEEQEEREDDRAAQQALAEQEQTRHAR
jgi:hypothetical protein